MRRGYNAAMTPIRGLFETHLPVRDVARSVAFYCDVVGLRLAYDLPARNAAFLWIGGPGRAMLGLWGAGSSPLSMKLHIAFDVAVEDVLAAPASLAAQGVELRGFSGPYLGEPEVIGWMPALATYFRDPDEHSIEYLAMLPDPPRPEAGIVRWSAWQAGGGGAPSVVPPGYGSMMEGKIPLGANNPVARVGRTYELLFGRGKRK